jgi:hypothetical protein
VKTRLAVFAPLTLALVACSAGAPEWTPLPSGADPPAACARADADGVIAILAEQARFGAPCMVAPAGVAFVVRFTNKDSEGHNVAIYKDRSKGNSVEVGEVISGPDKSIDYPVEALAAGEYYFDCSVHPAEMNGALYVR